MPRETSPYIVGDYWLDKRRDGKSPDIWQIATYSPKSRSDIYRSTKRRTVDLEAAKEVLRTFEAAERSKQQGQRADQSELVPHLFNYLREHGPDVHRLDTVKSSFRAWLGFLMQDELTLNATVAMMTPGAVARFRRWRMGPHSWEIEWGGKVFSHRSEGVTGESVQRNIQDLRAALNWADAEQRVTAPKIPSVDKKLRPKQPATVLTFAQLGALVGYAQDDADVYRELALMCATACRPGVSMAFDPASQWLGEIIDLQPARALTDKRNAVVPAIDPLLPILEDWKAKPHDRVKSRRRWWSTAKRALGMPGVEAYDIRHTVLTYMDAEGVPGAQLSGIAGHLPSSRGIARTTSANYLHYDPRNCPQAKKVLTKFFRTIMGEAKRWHADHLRTIPLGGQPISVVQRSEKC